MEAQIAADCTEILKCPENNVKKISELLKLKDNDGLVFLSLAKVFKFIVPLYKIRIHSEKVKHRNEEIKVSQFDRELLQQYNIYLKKLCASDILESYRAAAELLSTLDHFNFSDRLVAKVLLGTNKKNATGEFCIETLIDRVKNDVNGETVFMIIDKCLDYRFSYRVVEAMLESKYLERCVEIRIEKETYYDKEKIEQRKNAKKEKAGKGFFAKKFLIDKNQKKEEKLRLKAQKQNREQEEYSLKPLDEKNYIRTCNALQRLYFTILKTRNLACLESTYLGVRKFIKIIRKEFHEGLYTLMIDNLPFASTRASLEGMQTIYEVYKDSGFDFQRVINVLFRILSPLNKDLTLADVEKIPAIVKSYFIDIEQSKTRTLAFVQRLILARVTRYLPSYARIIKDLEVKYNLDFKDFDYKNKLVNNLDVEDIDKVQPKPLYEYFLFKKVQ